MYRGGSMGVFIGWFFVALLCSVNLGSARTVDMPQILDGAAAGAFEFALPGRMGFTALPQQGTSAGSSHSCRASAVPGLDACAATYSV